MFEDIGPPWEVYRYRPMPCTPAGDPVAMFESKDAADAAVKKLNEAGCTLEEARKLYAAPRTPDR
ncbi:MAG TPA: hypothetical protein VK973_05825 [Arenicellales bacterium]|nr:hypothetical protein [Arenicellales bacterium]